MRHPDSPESLQLAEKVLPEGNGPESEGEAIDTVGEAVSLITVWVAIAYTLAPFGTQNRNVLLPDDSDEF